MTKRIEVFEPLNPPFVKIYHCGITPYDYSHVGHLRSEVAIDTIRRVLRFLGYVDIAISNFTDIDDKIIKRANELNINWEEIPNKYIKYHLEVVKKINNLPFIVNPKVTEHINDIIEFIRDLIEKGYGYIGKTGVYFDVDKYPYYGQLSGRKEKNLWEQETEFLKDKKNPYDFALWKFKKEGEPYWNSPFGEGRPGWHIECSVMSSKYLGEQFDIHSGGQDLIFPHHENEIAQSESKFGKRPWVKYWIHIGYLTINGEKMSKSLGNIIPANDFLEKNGYMESRFFLVSTHYRDPLDINEEALRQSKEIYEYITSTYKTVEIQVNNLERKYKLNDEEIKILNKLLDYEKRFIENILNDIDTTEATKVLIEATKYINKEVIPRENFSLSYISYEFYNLVNRIYACWDKRKEEDIIYNLINLIIEVRNELRKRKEYSLSDKIREELRKIGIDLLDFPEKTVWRFIK